MKAILTVLCAGAAATSALAANVGLTVKSGNATTVNVGPGSPVDFAVQALLDNGNDNEGLALIGFDLHLQGPGGPVALPSDPSTVLDAVPNGAPSCTNPMAAFVKPEGITNPCNSPRCLGATFINGDYVQIGAATNTIKNDNDNPNLPCFPNCAPFPIGTPLLGVAQPGVCNASTIVSGTLNAPMAPGQYKLQVLNGFANVIKNGETLADPFLETEAANVLLPLPPPDAAVHAQLIINVSADVCTGIVSSNPTHCTTDSRRPHPPNNPGSPQGINSVAITFDAGCDVSSAAPGDFTVACTPAGAPCPTANSANTVDQTVTVGLSTPIPAKKWVCITHTSSGDKVCLGSIPGDTSGNRTTNPQDIIFLVNHLNSQIVLPTIHCDLDRSNTCAAQDIIALVDMLNGNGYTESYNNDSLPVLADCP